MSLFQKTSILKLLQSQKKLERKFELPNLPEKLKDWYLLSYPELIKELAKKKNT